MSDDMRDRLQAEFAEYDRAEMALSNAFGFIDDPSEWADAPDEHAQCWEDAAAAAQQAADAAVALAAGAYKIAYALEEAIPEEAPA